MRIPEAIPALHAFRSAFFLALFAGEAGAQSWLDTVAEIGELAAAGQYAEAAELGPRLLELASDDFGESSRQLAEAHLIVAEIQIATADTDSAAASILSALAIDERIEGTQSPALIDTYVFLGDAYTAGGRHGHAYEAYARARDLSRRNYGLSSPRQLESMRKMATAADSLGGIEEGIDLLREALTIFVATAPARQQAVQAARSFADWLSDRGYHAEASRQYHGAGLLLRAEDPPGGIRLLLRAAEESRLAGPDLEAMDSPSRYSIVHQALIDLATFNVDQPVLRAELWLELGNSALLAGTPGAAEQGYKAAWDALAVVENGDEIRQLWFAAPVPIRLAPPDAKELSDDPNAPTGFVEIRFTVEANGRAKDVEVVTAEPEGLLDRAAIRLLSRSRFRPRVENGAVVEATSTIRFEFSYDPELAEE